MRKGTDGGVTARKPLRQAVEEAIDEAESQSRTLFELSNLAEIYFAERVVLCEGKTDRRLLPLAYEQLHGHPPELDHIAFVSLGSCADIPKALRVLEAMGICASAVADLDFAYTHARSGRLLDPEAADIKKAKHILDRLSSQHGFTLNNNGLPQNDKKAGWLAADVWACFAADKEGGAIAEQSHTDLKAARVWVWPQGTIEQVMGVEDKGEEAIIEQEKRLRAMSAADSEQQMPSLEACFDWIMGM